MIWFSLSGYYPVLVSVSIWLIVFVLSLIYKEESNKNKSVHYQINHDEAEWDMNRFRPRNTQVIQPTSGEKIKLDDYEIIKYHQGHSLFSGKKLKWEHFDWVSYIGKTAHPIKKDEAYLFIGWRDEQPTGLTCNKIK